jgi:hypothetical protein
MVWCIQKDLLQSGIIDTNGKGWKAYQISLLDLIISNYKRKKITPELEEIILDLRLTKKFGCNRIKLTKQKSVTHVGN